MKDYKELLKLHKAGLINIVDIIKSNIQNSTNLELYEFNKDKLNLTFNDPNVIIFNIKHDVYLILYLMTNEPKWFTAKIYSKNQHSSLDKHNIIIELITSPKIYGIKALTYLNSKSLFKNISILDLFKTNSKIVQNLAADMADLNYDIKKFIESKY